MSRINGDATNNTLQGVYDQYNFLNGEAGDDVLIGANRVDWLNGGTGADTLIGGLGNDRYRVNDPGDIVQESTTAAGEIDRVWSTISYTLGANVEVLLLVGTAAIQGEGNSLHNRLWGNRAANVLMGDYGNDTLGGGRDGDDTLIGGQGNDSLNGGRGIDVLMGGAGNDRYRVNNVADIVSESSTSASEIDGVWTSVSFTLSANLENLTLVGVAGIRGEGNSLDNRILGNRAANVLTGGDGNDTLGGGMGNDTLNGGQGNDSLNGSYGADILRGGDGHDRYRVDNVGDVVVERSTLATDIDLVQASVSYTLSANVESLTLTGFNSLNGTGNSLANSLQGNRAANLLDGGFGADTMTGGAGNDTYVIDSVGDVIVESSARKTEEDMVLSWVSYTLGENLELLVLTGTAAINGMGNTRNNTLTGNSAANLLDGGTGVDTMMGGDGNDTYIVDDTSDRIVEASGAGVDLVVASVHYTLSANVEDLILTGERAIHGTGNDLANTFTGNSANNIFIGGTGNDTYQFARGGGVDLVMENDSSAGNTDVLRFLSGVAHDQLWFTQFGADLEIRIIGTNDKAVVKEWYSGTALHVERITTVDGNKTLLDTNIDNLVTAMASLTPPPLGQTTLSAEEHAQLDAVIAANWS